LRGGRERNGRKCQNRDQARKFQSSPNIL
jgi:hypothetical protein